MTIDDFGKNVSHVGHRTDAIELAGMRPAELCPTRPVWRVVVTLASVIANAPPRSNWNSASAPSTSRNGRRSQSTPACSSSIAALCLSTCGDTLS